jgi:hypothetical protein
MSETVLDECSFDACLGEEDGQGFGEKRWVELEKLGVDFLAHVRRSGGIGVEILDVEFDLVEKGLDGQSDGVVVGWLGKMPLPSVFGVQKVVAGLCEESFHSAGAAAFFRVSLGFATFLASASHEHERENESK